MTAWRAVARFGVREYLSQNPLLLSGGFALARTALLTLVLALVIGEEARAGIVGIALVVSCATAIVTVADVHAADYWSGSLFRVVAAPAPMPPIELLRALPHAAVGFAVFLGAALLAPVLAGAAGTVPLLAGACALAALAGASVLGLGVAALQLGRGNETLVGNVAAYLYYLLSGVIVLASGAELWTGAAWLLPGAATLEALRAGSVTPGTLAAEVAVALAWSAVAAAAVLAGEHLVRRGGHGYR